MFKFKSYNVKKESEKSEKEKAKTPSKTPTYSAMTMKKPPKKEKKKASPNEITTTSNKESPEYSKKRAVSNWTSNKTYSPKTETETKKVNIPTPHKKLERK